MIEKAGRCWGIRNSYCEGQLLRYAIGMLDGDEGSGMQRGGNAENGNSAPVVAQRPDMERFPRSEERSLLASDSLSVLIAYLDKDKRYQFCNARYKEWFGLEKSEIIGRNLVDVIGEEAFAKVESNFERALKGESLVVEDKLPYKNGPSRFVRIEYIPDAPSGSVEGLYVMVQDVTARRDAEERLRIFSEELSRTVDERTEELRVLNENIPAFFCYLDSDLRYRFVNKYFEEKFKESRSTLFGKAIRDTISAESFGDIEPLLKAALEGETIQAEVVLGILANEARVVRARFMPRIEKDGNIIGVFVLADDVTTERQLQQEVLMAAELENERFGRDLHDSICQELSGISMLGKALSQKLRQQDRDGIEEADELVRQILDVTQKSRMLARGLSPVALENRTLCEAIEELAENVENLFPEVTCRLVENLGRIGLDETVATQLYFITREAVFNAAKHGRKSNIEVEVKLEWKNLFITVADDGGGKASDIVEGMGIRSMRYRARTFGGALSIYDRGGPKGLVVVCRLRMESA